MLLTTINNLPGIKRQDELILISDFLYCLFHDLNIFKRITYLFPVIGYSCLPNDQDFGIVGNKRKKANIDALPERWDEVAESSRKYPSTKTFLILGV